MLRNFKALVPPEGNVLTFRWVDWPTSSAAEIQAITMPPETLALRAGEYGLDPNDADLLLDVVLHETFIAYPEGQHPLWTAPSIAAAREEHLDTVATERARQAALGVNRDRPKGYPTVTEHRAALSATGRLCPIRADVVAFGRENARRNWMINQMPQHGLAVRRNFRGLG